MSKLADMQIRDPVVASVNALTEKWAYQCSGGTVIAGIGVWPLLAILAASADGEARTELEAAIGVPAANGFSAAASLLQLLRSSEAVRAALGTWFAAQVPVFEEWQEAVPPGTWGQLLGNGKDKERLDAWAKHHTDGLIAALPVDLDSGTLFVWASAIAVKTRWLDPFTEIPAGFPFSAAAGPWRGRPNISTLDRVTHDLDEILIAESGVGLMTLVEVQGDKDITFYLAMADEGAAPGAVVGEAIRILGWPVDCRLGSTLRERDVAPGLTVEVEPSYDPEPVLYLSTVPFRIDADHDLLQHSDLFGLETATDTSRGHFPRISPVPLAVQQARQTAMAVFTEEGFEAAAVTVMDAVPGAVSPWAEEPDQERLEVTIRFDRPFAFVAVHQPSRLVLVAGWVAEPEPAEPAGKRLPVADEP